MLHIAGNVGYDPIRSGLVCTVDSTSGKSYYEIIDRFSCLFVEYGFNGVKERKKANTKRLGTLACILTLTKSETKENLRKLLSRMALGDIFLHLNTRYE